MKVAFLGTPAFAVPSLDRLVDAGHHVALVVTQPDRPAGRGRDLLASPAKEAAVRLGLEIAQPTDQTELLAALEAIRPDVAVVAAFGQILSADVLALPPRGFLNVHPSLLPRLRGATPVPSAILEGASVTGVTIMQVTRGVDAGPIVAQLPEPIRHDDTAASLLVRLAGLGADLLVETLPGWAAGRLVAVPQDLREATYCRQLRKEDGQVDWRRPAVELWRRCRALQPWPGFQTTYQGRALKLIDVAPLSSREGHRPGAVFQSDGGTAVACGTGALLLRKVQAEGRRALSIDEFVRGQPGLLGATLGP